MLVGPGRRSSNTEYAQRQYVTGEANCSRVLLCPTCHTRHDAGQIRRKSTPHYKASVAVVSHRYGDMERRISGRLH